MTFLEAFRDPLLFGAAFREPESWRAWETFASAAYGLALDAEGRALFAACTGRPYDPPPGGWREVVCVVGRQAGKTRFGAALVAYEAIAAEPARDGERYALLLAQDARAAVRTAFGYIKALVDASPLLRRAVVRETAGTLALENGVTIAAYPCRPQAVRGLRAVVVILDELAFFRSSELLPQDVEMVRAVRPCLAMTGGRLVILSSPHAQQGALWELHRRYYGQPDADVFVWQSAAPRMNPCLSPSYLARAREADPEAARSEVEGMFRDDVASYVTREALTACVIPDRRELPPAAAQRYVAFVDPSGGSADSFTLAIAHAEQRDGEQAPHVVLDVIRERRPPFSPDAVVREFSETLKRYGVTTIGGDRYAGQWPRERFGVYGIHYEPSTQAKSELYSALLPLVNAGRVELLDERRLLAQLAALERRTARGGRDSIDHAPGSHDDVANAAAGALVAAEAEAGVAAFDPSACFAVV